MSIDDHYECIVRIAASICESEKQDKCTDYKTFILSYSAALSVHLMEIRQKNRIILLIVFLIVCVAMSALHFYVNAFNNEAYDYLLTFMVSMNCFFLIKHSALLRKSIKKINNQKAVLRNFKEAIENVKQ